MNDILLQKINELIEKIDLLAGKTLDVKRQECAHIFEGACTGYKQTFQPCVITEKDWCKRIKGWQHGRCKFCGIKMTAYLDSFEHPYIDSDKILQKARKVLGWPDNSANLVFGCFYNLDTHKHEKTCKIL